MGRLLAEGVVVLNVDLEYLENLVDGIRVFDRQTIIITDESGRALLSVGPEKLIHLELSTVLGNSDAVDHRFAGRHPEYFVTTHHPDGSGWGYVSLVPRADVYRIPMRMLRTSVGVFGIGSVIAVVLMVILSRRSFLQIGHLVDLIEDVERSGEPVHPEFRGKKSEIRENLTYSLMRNFVEAQLLPIKDSEQRYRRKTLQLLAMQSQVSPHFLFNTLETITWKSYRFTDGPNEVTEVLEKLAEVLEYALTRTGETVTLDDELSVARRYIEIQQVRYRELFEIEWEIDHGLTDAVVLPMILLPLLENAIYHGLRNVEKHGKIVVSVEARDEKSVELVVRDNGDGITRKKLDEINHRLKHDSSAVEHIGLYNTNKRIELAFGAPFGLSIESVENVGTSVTVALPLLFG
ncbi:MAG: sensor histidine kinase [Spirochaetaceae bacterium]|nr:MAG: sensor histidine kinase [Spirochaetaceae bacterium]